MTHATVPKAPAARLEGTTPILRVQSLQASLDYYVEVLGFSIDWQDSGIVGSVSRDGAAILLCQGDQGHPGAWVWIGVDDVAVLFEEYRARGAALRIPPTNYPWGREMQVEDPDGNVLRFGSDASGEGPFGAWRDMRGALWVRSPEGTWSRVEPDARA